MGHGSRLTWRRVAVGMLVAVGAAAAGYVVWPAGRSLPPARPVVVLRVATPDGWRAELLIPAGESATVSIGGVQTMALRPRLDGDRVALEVVAPGGSPGALFRLERSASVRITRPVKFDVEWTGVQDIAEPSDPTSGFSTRAFAIRS